MASKNLARSMERVLRERFEVEASVEVRADVERVVDEFREAGLLESV